MKIIQTLIVLFAIIGCLALALGGFFVYNMTQNGGDNFLTRLRKARATQTAKEQTTATVVAKDSEYAAIINKYQPTPAPTPVAVAAQPGMAPAGAPAQMAAPAAPTPKPVRTPKPDEGKIRGWPTGHKWVALTYDDGPHPEWTAKVMELLKSKNVRATFFLLGQEIERRPDIAKTIVENGFEVGNHTMTHPDFNDSSMTPEKIKYQLQHTNDLIAEYVTKKPIQIMRPPYGNTPKKLEKICQEMGLNIICWDIDTNDWRSGITSDEMVDNIMKNLKDGAIILMHDRHQKTYDTTAAVIDPIREKGYTFVTVNQLLGLEPVGPGPADPKTPTGAPAPAPQAQAPAAAPTQSDISALPIPAAAESTQAPTEDTLDASKITVPPSSK